MQDFINIACNPSSKNVTSKPNTRIANYNLFVAFVALNLLANRSVVQAKAKSKTNNHGLSPLTKTIRYCINCKYDYHIGAEYHKKHLHLQEAKSKSTKSSSKWRCKNTESDYAISKNKAVLFIVQL